jgi:hypothetical protein
VRRNQTSARVGSKENRGCFKWRGMRRKRQEYK